MPDLCGLFKFQKRGSYTFEKMQNLEVQIFFPVENCIDPTITVYPVKDLESFVLGLISEELRRYHMTTAFCIRSAVAWCTVPQFQFFFP